ncbi:hypothetical protein T4E_8591 [Trichinella pseudospiralis]|uniref:Uncharacterized protein n=1 Tax=Trichinella pseudospiralis TaxID=6337 RepID=A0A0V0YK71_TRIPS|nr:hypothetical protein T4E_8591 [Trichinella pseudospiralis]
MELLEMATVKCHDRVLRRYKGSGRSMPLISVIMHTGNERETISTVNLIWCQKTTYSPLAAT